ncbi:peptidase T [Mergibacter septicus]|uniref:tripeptide aminopeptidase PepT n=1 Tax=Mergibacter septicus TaxID=221402 RepID=UPI001C759F72|nr:tripeptide aminopeptidase PepT [Mergibacter septicus]QDJ12933.1 peptidase T [Mergibacter septicus]
MGKEDLSHNQLLTRFLNYISYDTQAKISGKKSPSSSGQWLLAKFLQQELLQLGLEQVELSQYCTLTAYLPTNQKQPQPTIGFIAHLDTTTDLKGKNIQAEVIEQYRGGDIALGLGEAFISPVEYPFLQKLVGHTLIVSDGTTLLGADNKAGIAEIITALEQLRLSDQPRPNLRIAFIPDKNTGLGMQFFPLEQFHCDWAYTLTGGEVGVLEYENVYTALATINIIKPSSKTNDTKNNPLAIAYQFQQALLNNDNTKETEHQTSSFLLQSFQGDLANCKLDYLIQDSEPQTFLQCKNLLKDIANNLSQLHHLSPVIEVALQDSCQNISSIFEKVPQSISLADQAIKNCAITPIHKTTRHNPLEAWFAQHGVACPNLFAGCYNPHSYHELASLNIMQQAIEVILEICRLGINKQ